MKTEQRIFENEKWSSNKIILESQLVFAFIGSKLIKDRKYYNDLKKFYPKADIIMISTSGEIYDDEIYDNTVSVTSLYFEKTSIKVLLKEVKKIEDSFESGKNLAKKILKQDLKYSLVFSDGLRKDGLFLDGESVLKGINSIFLNKIGITGGLSGSLISKNKSLSLESMYISLNGVPNENSHIIMIGFYGDAINIGNASFGGWSTFGMERTITKSENNIVYEIDNEPALDLYKKYLGDKYSLLPHSGIIFPLGIYKEDKDNLKIRTLMGIDKDSKSVIFTGSIPEGHKAYLMTASFGNLIEGAKKSIINALKKNSKPEFALIISCVGRRLVLKQRIEEELEEVKDILGDNCKVGGFYSYGEIGINELNDNYQLHNQTMTVALFSED